MRSDLLLLLDSVLEKFASVHVKNDACSLAHHLHEGRRSRLELSPFGAKLGKSRPTDCRCRRRRNRGRIFPRLRDAPFSQPGCNAKLFRALGPRRWAQTCDFALNSELSAYSYRLILRDQAISASFLEALVLSKVHFCAIYQCTEAGYKSRKAKLLQPPL